MTRKEMIKVIWNYIEEVECDYDCYMNPENADTLLSKIEAAGMLPPPHTQTAKITSQRLTGFTWEPEDG